MVREIGTKFGALDADRRTTSQARLSRAGPTHLHFPSDSA